MDLMFNLNLIQILDVQVITKKQIILNILIDD